MQHEARVGNNPFFRKARDFFLHRVLRKRGTSADNSDEQKKEHLYTFISTLVQTFFDPLADHLPAPTVFSEIEETETKRIIIDSLQNKLSKEIITYLKAQHPSEDVVIALLEYFHNSFRRNPKFSNFLESLQAAFSNNNAEIQQSEGLTRYPSPPRTRYLSPELLIVVEAIARAIQDTVIDTPSTYFDVDKSVPEDAREVLKAILNKVEVIRKRYLLHASGCSVLELSVALRELGRKIALVEGYIWLPFAPPITAPLTSLEDLTFYTRGEDDAKRLSYQILQGEGVFLITGYRGVGKSTMINQALSLCSTFEQQQRDSQPWHVVPVVVNLAKASSVTSVLRLCIRKLYNNLLKDESTKKLLTQEEHNDLISAYLRATYNVNLQRIESTEIVKHIESQLSLNVKLASLISPIASGLADSLPSFGGAVQASRDWKNTSERTISLPDYDEDKAEEDIVDLIKKLSQLRSPTRHVRIKLVFVFDEIDKMKAEEQDLLLNQLKNLFLERHTVFLFVTSKEFYYRLVQERKVEDAMLTSYFSWIKMVPLFNSDDTAAMLKRLILLDETLLTEASKEMEFLRTFARYLTYRSRGNPREIIRELQGLLQWGQDDLQAYLTSRLELYHAVLVYEQLQKALERIVDNVSPTVPSPSSGIIEAISLSSSLIAASPTQATLVPEPIWMNEERREQVKWGLYVLVEELLDQVSLEMNPDAAECKKIYESNFTMFSPRDFKSLLDRLVLQLPKVRLPIAAGSSLAENYSGSEIAFFAELPLTEGSARKLAVLPAFYALTGRQVVSTMGTVIRRDADLTFDQVEGLLQKDEPVSQQRALYVLQQKPGPFSTAINLRLCRLFVAGRILDFRLDAAGLLQDPVSCRTLYELDEDALAHFLDAETNEKLLQECIRLITTSADTNGSTHGAGTQLLLRMLDRQKPYREGVQQQRTLSLRLPEPILLEAVLTLAKISDDGNNLAQVIERLEPNLDVPESLLPSLQSLETKSDRTLVELLVLHNFTGVAEETLQTLLKGRSESELMDIWNVVIGKKQQAFAQRVLISIALRALGTSMIESVGNQVLAWLKSPSWDTVDQQVLDKVTARDPSVLNTLVKVVPQDKGVRIRASLPRANVPAPELTGSGRLNDQNRQRMIARVRTIWIEGVLRQSLYLETRIALGLHEQPDAVAKPWSLLLEGVNEAPHPLSQGTHISEVYDQAGGGLLILGEPGAGKTTLLVELAADLLKRAEQDAMYPIPVIFNLASWATRKQPLVVWFVEELSIRYEVPRRLGQSWVSEDRLLLLLDGLDEVTESMRGACVEAINIYRQEHNMVPVVVCSRIREYFSQESRLMLNEAVVIQPLTREQIEAYLSSAGPQMDAIRILLREDPVLEDLMTTPLVLNIQMVAYQGKSTEHLPEITSLEESERYIFAAYVQRMLQRRGAQSSYLQQQTVHWLNWLAQQLVHHNQTVFYIERMQSDWLPEGQFRQIYAVTTRLFISLLGVLSFGLAGALGFGLAGVLGFGLAGVLSFGLAGMLGTTIRPVEVISLSWKSSKWERRNLLVWLVFWGGVGIVIGLLKGAIFGLLIGLGFGVFGMLSLGLLGASSEEMLGDNTRLTTNQGIKRSARNGLSFGLLFGLGFGLIYGLGFGQQFGLGSGLLYGLSFGLLFGLLSGLLFGGWASIQHVVLHFLLWRSGAIPADYVRFLDYATERILLRKVGGGYIFIHRLLLDYFASLTTK